jgi:hypothetical protein
VTIVSESIEIVDLAEVSPVASSQEPEPKKDDDEVF